MLEDSSLVHREPTRSSSYFSIPSFYRKKGSGAVVKPEGLSKVGEGESGACDPSLLTNSSENKGKKGELDVREVESFTEFIFPSRFSRTPKQRLRSISATEHREQSDSHKVSSGGGCGFVQQCKNDHSLLTLASRFQKYIPLVGNHYV